MASYRVIGSDRREYGPVSLERLRDWAGEGRVNATTQVCMDGSSEWQALGSLAEFSSILAGPAARTPLAGTRRTNPWALCGFMCGLISISVGCCCCCCLPVDLFGLVVSVIGLVQISRAPETEGGTVLAILGLILCLFSITSGFTLSALWMAGGGAEAFHQEWERGFRFRLWPLADD